MAEYEALLLNEQDYNEEGLIFGGNDLTSVVLSSKYDEIVKKLDNMHRYIILVFKTGKFRSSSTIKNIQIDIKSTNELIIDLKKNHNLGDSEVMQIIDNKLCLLIDMLNILDRSEDVKKYGNISSCALLVIMFELAAFLILVVILLLINIKIYDQII